MQKTKFPNSIHKPAVPAFLTNTPLILKGLAITLVAYVLYFQDLSVVFADALRSEQTFHILAVPFLFTYLLYRKRRMVNATTAQNVTSPVQRTNHLQTLAGILLAATAVIIYWYGSYTFIPLEYHIVTLPFFAAGLILTMFDWKTLKQLLFPIAFLIFLAPPPVEILYNVGSALSSLSSEAANALVNLFGVASSLSAEYGNPILTITRPDKSILNFTVDIACSGIYSLIGFAIFAIFIAYITRGKLRNKLAVLVLGVPLIITLNIVRITTILAIGYNYGEQLALQVFHTVGATVLMFLATLLLLGITEKFIKKTKPQQPCPICEPSKPNIAEEFCLNCGKLLNPRVTLRRNDVVKIIAVVTIVALLLSVQAPVFALTEGPAQVIVQTPSGEQGNTQILPQVPGYALQYVYRDNDFENLAHQDASLLYTYVPTDKTKLTVWVAIEVAPTIGPLHRWETCLVNYPLSQGYQPKVTQIDLRDIQTLQNPPITARYFAFQYTKTNQTQLVLYWYETAQFTINGTSQQKHVKMSLETYPKTPELVAEAETELLPFATAINEYWQPIKTWAVIALTISQNGLALSAATTVLLGAMLVGWLFIDRQERASLLKLSAKLPESNQLTIRAVKNAQEKGNPTTQGVLDELQKLTETTITIDWLTARLNENANAGLIRKTIANRFDEPTIQWKNQVHEKTSPLKRLHI